MRSYSSISWWRHQMETFSALLAICAGNSPVPGEFPAQRPVTRSFDAFFDLRPNKRLSKQPWGWWFETLWRPLWRHRNVMDNICTLHYQIKTFIRSLIKKSFLNKMMHIYDWCIVASGAVSCSYNLWTCLQCEYSGHLNSDTMKFPPNPTWYDFLFLEICEEKFKAVW